MSLLGIAIGVVYGTVIVGLLACLYDYRRLRRHRRVVEATNRMSHYHLRMDRPEIMWGSVKIYLEVK